MKEIECTIIESVKIDEREFYIISEKDSKEIHYIPRLKVDSLIEVNLGDCYLFSKEYNHKINKPFLNLILPSYKIGSIIDFKITNKSIINDLIIFELESPFKQPLTVRGPLYQLNQSSLRCKIINYKRGIPKLHNIDTTNSRYTIDDIILFKIRGYDIITDVKGNKLPIIIVAAENGDEIQVLASTWHTRDFWTFEDIRCKIISISDLGMPRLRVYDDRHPLYTVNSKYKFQVTGFSNKILKSGTKIELILLGDHTNFNYEVLALPFQHNKLTIGQEIECEVVSITNNLNLRQTNPDDPFFSKFEEIVKDKLFKNKYFDRYLTNDYINLTSQYTQKSAFWVFTYCNTIISEIKRSAFHRKDFSEIIEIIGLHTQIENWILSSGILQAINDENDRKKTKLKIQQIIKNNHSELKILTYILNYQEQDFYNEQQVNLNFKEYYYFIKYSNLDYINIQLLLNPIKSQLSAISINREDYHFIKRIIYFIENSNISLKAVPQYDYFILSKELSSSEKNTLLSYVKLLIFMYELMSIINSTVECNIILSKIFRLYTFIETNYELNKYLLLNAFYALSNRTDYINLPIAFIDNEVRLDFDHISENPNVGITFLNLSEPYFVAQIDKKHYQGYNLIINDVSGFLPYQNICDPALKAYTAERIDWAISCAITLYCDDFKYFIAKQIEPSSIDYYSKNNLYNNTPLKGLIVYGTIKNITDFGIFIVTEYGDGLLHHSNIGREYNSKAELSLIFEIGDKIPVYILNVENNKIELSLIHLIGTKFEREYYELFEVYAYDVIDVADKNGGDLEFKIELEKGFIFERYAVIQKSIYNKIKYIKFAKAFFSNTRNARSYLLNIYIEYFNSLIKLDELLENYSFDEYDKYRKYIVQIKEKVDPLTLQNFPESKNLLFFIDILNLFNSQREEDIQLLFDLTRKPIEEDDILLKAVAKNALANNLIISELRSDAFEQLNSFTYSNLKRIREYISEGVLSVKESAEDRLAKELNEKISYWKNKINQDEGEKLEFKATFITPIPNKEQGRIINHLEKQLSKELDNDKIVLLKNKISALSMSNEQTWDIRKLLIHSALKTICAFANTNGGYLLIGVSDDKQIFGLEQDYNSFKEDKNRDGFGKYFDEMIKDYFGDSFSASLLEKEFLKFPEGDILIVKVNRCPSEVFLLRDERGNRDECIYVRNLSSSIKLKGVELAKFIKTRLSAQLQQYSGLND